MSRLLRTEARVKPKFKTLRKEHQLVARAFRTAQDAQARRILLASARTGDGKSHLARCIEQYGDVVTDEHFEVAALSSRSSRPEAEKAYVWADGVALREGEGAAALTPAIRATVAALSSRSSRPEAEKGYVWVDGVALLEGEGAAALTPAIRATLDGALLVARGMVTTRAELRECAERLRVLGMPVLGGVWNDVACPPPMETVRAFANGFRTWPPRLPPGVFVRQIRGPS